MKNILILLAFIVSFNTFAERVYIKNYFDNGIMKSEGWTENNKKIEHWKYYHTNGNLEKAGDYKIDLKEGFWNFYHKNKTLKAQGILKRIG